ncbi:helix-turn-helix domain-containing protein [Planctomycetota bacterium]
MSNSKPHEIQEHIRRMTPVSAPPDQHQDIIALFRLLDRAARVHDRDLPQCRIVGPKGESTLIPDAVLYALGRVAEILGRGDAITVVPVGKEITTQQAADILNVSRQYLVRLLDEGRIPYTKTGKHRRILVGDLLAFKKERDRSKQTALDRLTQLSEELGGYSELT